MSKLTTDGRIACEVHDCNEPAEPGAVAVDIVNGSDLIKEQNSWKLCRRHTSVAFSAASHAIVNIVSA